MSRKQHLIAWAFSAACFYALLPVGAQAASSVSSFPAEEGMHRVRVKTVILDSRNNQPVVVLEDKKRGKLLPIWIGPAEARAILMQLKGVAPSRPMTHDLLTNVIGGLKANVDRVIITELKGGTFYAHIVMKSSEREFAIDSRPSDAIALALRTRAPIFAKDRVMQEGTMGPKASALTHRDRLGIVLQTMTLLLAKYFGGGIPEGLLVSQVLKSKPGEKSGLRKGDVIYLVEGKKISTVKSFEREFVNNENGLNVSVRRGAEAESIRLRLAAANAGGKTE